MSDTNDGPVVVTQARIYELLLGIDSSVKLLTADVVTARATITDHEQRLREIEQREDLSRRVAEMERTVKSLQQRVWAIPSASVLIAAAALSVTLIRVF